MRSPLALLLVLTPQQVRFDPAPGTAVVRELALETRHEGVPCNPDESCERRLWLRVRDEHLEIGAHRPARIRRRIESFELEGEHTRDGIGEGFELASPLTGRAMSVEWDGVEAPMARFEDEDRFQDDALLEGLPLGLDLHGLAPGREVAAGDTWYVDAVEVLDLLRLEALAEELPAGCSPAGMDPDGLEGQLRVVFAGELLREGTRLARLRLAGSLRREGSSVSFEPDHHIGLGYHADAEVELREELRGELGGVVLWDLDSHRWSELSLTLTLQLEETEVIRWGDRRVEWDRRWSGEVSVSGWSDEP